jgi:cholesterol oxidase
MKEAAEKAGYGDRFTKMPVAITFDPNFTYTSLIRSTTKTA